MVQWRRIDDMFDTYPLHHQWAPVTMHLCQRYFYMLVDFLTHYSGSSYIDPSKTKKRCTGTSGGGAYCEDKKQNCSPCLFQRTLPLPNPSSFLNTSSPCCQLCLFCFSPMVPQTPLVKCQPVCQLADSALDTKHLLGKDFPHKYCMCPD